MGVVDVVTEELDSLASYLAEDPLLAVGLAALIVALAVIGGVVIRWLRRTPGERFARIVAGENSLAVLMHPDPDPDAMSAALAVQELADGYDTDTTLYYSGEIRHHENRAFETVLDVDFEPIETAAEIDEGTVVLVDHNEPRGVQGAETIDPIAVVDHHPGEGTGTEFTDVRTDTGACATILGEYFEDLGWQPVGPDAVEGETDPTLSPPTATALMHGIQSDTKHLTSGCSEAEFDAAAFLYGGIDEDKLDRIANPDVDPESLEVKARAITERDVRSAFAVSDVGTVSNVDAIPQAADELRRLEGVNAVVVLGDKDGTIHLSGRSTDDRVHIGKVIGAVVEEIPQGGGGGHARMGGGQCSLEHMGGLGPGEGISREQLKENLFAAMNGEL